MSRLCSSHDVPPITLSQAGGDPTSASAGGAITFTPISATYYICPDDILKHDLLAVSPLLGTDCHAIFTPTSLSFFHPTSSTPYITGSKAIHDSLWLIDIPPPCPSPNCVLSVRSSHSLPIFRNLADATFVAYQHRAFGNPANSTFSHAVSQNYLSTIPRLTTKIIAQNPPLPLATSFGHQNLIRKNLASSRKSFPPAALSLSSSLAAVRRSRRLQPPPPPEPSDTPYCLLTHRSEWTSSDLTGRYPIPSRDGHEYILVTVFNNYIHLTPQKSRSSAAYVSSFTSILAFFKSRNSPILHLHIDNESSTPVRTLFQ